MSSTVTQTQPVLVTDSQLMKAKIQVGSPKVRIIYEDYDDVSVQYELKDFSLKDFDYFVRQRFQIAEGTALKYSQDLEEVVPTAAVLGNGPILVTETRQKREKKAGTSHKGTHVEHYLLYAAGIMLTFAMAIAPRTATMGFGAKFFELLENASLHLGLPSSGLSNTEWRTLYIEAFVTFMCRAFTELVVRRGCNPENLFHIDSVLRRFSIDSVFAGLAASVAIFVRKVALANLR